MNYIYDELLHYGVGADDDPPGRGSGRYPKGSGENPNQHSQFSRATYRELKANGLSDKEIAKFFDISTTELRKRNSLEFNAERLEKRNQLLALTEQGMSVNAAAKQLGIAEPTARGYLKDTTSKRASSTQYTADKLKTELEKGGFIDVGYGVERYLGCSRTHLNTALKMLEDEGYVRTNITVDQAGTGKGKKTTIAVLAPPGTTWQKIMNNKESIREIQEIEDDYVDTGKTLLGFDPSKFKSIDSNRIMVRYAEDGGVDKDGVIEVRKGAKDLDLGASMYAQVRIAVDDTHYLKGMMMYSDGKEMPPGVDIIFNTNKHRGTPLKNPEDEHNEVLKRLKDDPDNPFGAAIKRGGQRGAINVVNEEGDWGEWSKTIASQMLSKQSLSLVKRQLDITYKDRQEQFDEIKAINNGAVKKKLLKEFAESCDSSAIYLKAAAFPRQASHVILPITDMKETQIYAPKYENGERVALIRYPHQGIFEIPILTVNNRQATANDLIGGAKDAVGINAKVAERLSGADFDGDTVLVIPVNEQIRIKNSEPLKGIKEWGETYKDNYKLPPNAPKMTTARRNQEMGKVSNLITDMTVQHASDEDMTKAVKHAMLVIDAKKHHLDYKQSEKDNDIAELKAKYQSGGASTLISRAKGRYDVPDRKLKRGPNYISGINKETGEIEYEETGKTYTKTKRLKDGTWEVVKENVPRMQTITKMEAHKNAFDLSSGTEVEDAYADYANKCKAMANEARKLYISTPTPKKNKEAEAKYAQEVHDLGTALLRAEKNAPRERQAQLLTEITMKQKLRDNPELYDDKDKLKKMRNECLKQSRDTVGASKAMIEITDKQWEAIEAGAISGTQLTKILNNTKPEIVKKLAIPRDNKQLNASRVAFANAMHDAGYTYAEIGERLGISASAAAKIVE